MLRGWSDDPAGRWERDRDRARLASKVHTVGPFQPRGAAVLRLGLIVREYWERRVAWRARVFPARTMPAHTIPMPITLARETASVKPAEIRQPGARRLSAAMIAAVKPAFAAE